MSDSRLIDYPGFQCYRDTYGTSYVCDACQCVVMDPPAHAEVCPNREGENIEAQESEGWDQPVENSEWMRQPLTIVVTTRNRTHYVIDGAKDDTRVSLSGLDDVDKAALTVLLKQALHEMNPPHTFASGGPVIMHTTSPNALGPYQ